MEVTLRQLGVFVAIADHEGFGAAATALGMSQSSVSHSLAALERAVQGELVCRAAPVRPTPLGDVLLPHARATLSAARGFTAAAAAHTSAAAGGSIGLAVPPTAARGLLPGLLRLWHEQLPHVEITLFEGLDGEIGEWLESGTVDAAILVDPDPLPRGALHLATDAYEAVVRSDHPLAGEESIELADLLEDPLLATTSGCENQVKHLHSLTGLPYRPTQRIRELTTLLCMVEAGLGVAIVPSLAASMLSKTLTLVPLRPRLERRLVLTGPTSRPWHPNVTAIRELAEKHVSAPASS
ncbi:LysR family transcriptional regulator [Streptomyces acidicola]|uniref:LysR family transcriptional regulator n=1 Tax=Streptomyces acidicola TaxID=2596892 RepID=A0A5N8WN14_9ACTN|nr:LysR family transcriptional regulator [Streptomyces acidicola]MPY48639.1 LysR family transcriptional regulator [Streptomyces acidicola]